MTKKKTKKPPKPAAEIALTSALETNSAAIERHQKYIKKIIWGVTSIIGVSLASFWTNYTSGGRDTAHTMVSRTYHQIDKLNKELSSLSIHVTENIAKGEVPNEYEYQAKEYREIQFKKKVLMEQIQTFLELAGKYPYLASQNPSRADLEWHLYLIILALAFVIYLFYRTYKVHIAELSRLDFIRSRLRLLAITLKINDMSAAQQALKSILILTKEDSDTQPVPQKPRLGIKKTLALNKKK